MARRISLQDPVAAIECIERDGGVILTDFSSPDDVDRVSQDAAPYINAIVEEVDPHNESKPAIDSMSIVAKVTPSESPEV